MTLQFKDIRNMLARNSRLSICMFKDQSYENFLLISDVPEHKYDDSFIYGIGIIDTEFPMDVYRKDVKMDYRHIDLQPAIEIVLDDHPRSFDTISDPSHIQFKDLRPFLDRLRNITITYRNDWRSTDFEFIRKVPDTYDTCTVYGIGMGQSSDHHDFTFNQKENLVIIIE